MQSLGKIIVLAGLAMATLSACQTTDQLTGSAAEELENKVIGKWEGKWNGTADSTVEFSKRDSGGLNVVYCFKGECYEKNNAFAYADNTIQFTRLNTKWVYNLKSPEILHGEYTNNWGGYGVIDMTRVQ